MTFPCATLAPHFQAPFASGYQARDYQTPDYHTPPDSRRTSQYPSVMLMPGSDLKHTPLKLDPGVLLPAWDDEPVTAQHGTNGTQLQGQPHAAAMSNEIAHAIAHELPRDIPGHRRISACERLGRGFLFGLRDCAATLGAATVRLMAGEAVMRARSRPATIAILSGVSVLHMGICRWMYKRVGPVVADSSHEARTERKNAERWAKAVIIATACAAATMVPMVFAVQHANRVKDDNGVEVSDGRQAAMAYAVSLIAQSIGNVMRDWIVFRSKGVLPPTILELSNPTLADTQRQVHDKLEGTKESVLLASTIAYMVVLYGTGVLSDFVQAENGEWIGESGQEEFPQIDAWRKSFLILNCTYVLAETLDQWLGQLIASRVQHSRGVSQYLRTAEKLPARVLDPAQMPPMNEPTIKPLHGTRAAVAEVLFSSTERSNIVYASGILSALMRDSVMPDRSQGDSFNLAQSLWRQVLRTLLALAESRNWFYQKVSKCTLTSLSNHDSSNVERAWGSVQIREAFANEEAAAYIFPSEVEQTPPPQYPARRPALAWREERASGTIDHRTTSFSRAQDSIPASLRFISPTVSRRPQLTPVSVGTVGHLDDRPHLRGRVTYIAGDILHFQLNFQLPIPDEYDPVGASDKRLLIIGRDDFRPDPEFALPTPQHSPSRSTFSMHSTHSTSAQHTPIDDELDDFS